MNAGLSGAVVANDAFLAISVSSGESEQQTHFYPQPAELCFIFVTSLLNSAADLPYDCAC